ncbi:MAG: methionyl-tRNA formyltransferase, partial [Chloroflexota bacterium]|nr:methionyl-tRNA formyltransferase [Chloroflexota bacterium]
NGDPMTGVSIMKLVRKLDAGPLVAQVEAEVRPDDTTGSLSERLADLSARMLPDVAREYVADKRTPVPQDETLATHTREWSTADAEIDWSQPARQIERLVRAANPWPVAWTTDGVTRLRVLAGKVAAGPFAGDQPPGTLSVSAGHVEVATADGALVLDLVQPAGKRGMPAGDWWRGTRRVTTVLGSSPGDE